MKIKFYNLPIHYSKSERFYKTLQGVGELPAPSFEIDSQKEDEKNFSLTIVDKFNAILQIKQNILDSKNKDFNYIEISGRKHLRDNIHYWFVIPGSEKTGVDNFSIPLHWDVFLNRNIFKALNKDLTVNVERRMDTAWKKISENNQDFIVPDGKDKPHIWDNKEFASILPSKKIIKDITLEQKLIITNDVFPSSKAKIFTVTDDLKNVEVKFSVDYHTSETLAFKKDYSLPLSCVVALIKENFKLSKYHSQTNNLSDIASYAITRINPFNQHYSSVSIAPVVYTELVTARFEKWYPRNSKPEDNYKKWIKELIDKSDLKKHFGNYDSQKKFKDIYDNKIDLDSEDVVVFMAAISSTVALNRIHLQISNAKLQNISAAIIKLFNFDNIKEDSKGKKTILLQDLIPNIVLSNAAFEGGSSPEGPIRWWLYKNNYNQLNTPRSTKNINKDFKFVIDNKLMDDYDVYKYLNLSVSSNTYNPIFIDIVGTQIAINNRFARSHSQIHYEIWTGTNEQNISIYTGYLDENKKIKDPQHVSKVDFSALIEFSRNIGQINYELRKNSFEARIAQVSGNKIAYQDQVEEMLNANIARTNAVAKSQSQQIEDTRAANWLQNAKQDDLTFLQMSYNPKEILKGIFTLGTNFRISRNRFAAQREQINSLANAQSKAIEKQAQATNQMAKSLAIANSTRIEEDAKYKRLVILAEAADLRNLPNQTVNTSNITKFQDMTKNHTSLIEMKIKDDQHKTIWHYFNHYGNRNYGLFIIKANDSGWFKTHAFWDYFQGGNWTRYLNEIGIYDKDIIQEINKLFKNGVKLLHREYKYDKYVKNKYEYNELTPNWPIEIIGKLLEGKD